MQLPSDMWGKCLLPRFKSKMLIFFFIWYKLAHTTSHDRFFFQKVAFRKGHPLIWGNIQVGDSFICFQSCIWKLVILLENSVRKPQGRTSGNRVTLLPAMSCTVYQFISLSYHFCEKHIQSMISVSNIIWVVVSNICFFFFNIEIWGNDPILTNVFQMGWFNHQLVYHGCESNDMRLILVP